MRKMIELLTVKREFPLNNIKEDDDGRRGRVKSDGRVGKVATSARISNK